MEKLLLTIREYREAAHVLYYTTGQENFDNFRQCLKSQAREEWDLTVPAIREPRTMRAFEETRIQWKIKYILEDVFEIQGAYIETVDKPFKMTVQEFAYRVQFLNNCLTEFPQPEGADILTVTQIKNIIFRAMPQEWQTNFANANIHLNAITLPVLIDYMTA
jgi:hypothetical protein